MADNTQIERNKRYRRKQRNRLQALEIENNDLKSQIVALQSRVNDLKATAPAKPKVSLTPRQRAGLEAWIAAQPAPVDIREAAKKILLERLDELGGVSASVGPEDYLSPTTCQPLAYCEQKEGPLEPASAASADSVLKKDAQRYDDAIKAVIVEDDYSAEIAALNRADANEIHIGPSIDEMNERELAKLDELLADLPD